MRLKITNFTLSLTVVVLFFTGLNAQIPDGSIAPDWTLTDLDGNTHHLYEILESGRSVVIDFSATWCGPCWNYHNNGVLETLWEDYGPDGSDEIMVFFLEGDLGTNDDCLYGLPTCSGTTQGNWVAGTPYPICNIPPSQSSVVADYQVPSWPCFYMVCPEKKTYYLGYSPSLQLWRNWIEDSCPLDATYLVEEAICAEDGSIDLSPEAGYGSLSYSWSNGDYTQDIEDLAPDFYSVTITDANGHSINIDDIEVEGNETPLMVDLDELVDNYCPGESNGILSVSAVNGIPPISYEWDNGETGQTIEDLPEGDYTVTLTDANDCISIETFELIDPDELFVEAVTVDATCGEDNGEMELSGAGGTGTDYQYDIGFGFSYTDYYYYLSPGLYEVAIMDENGCESYYSQVYLYGGPDAIANAGEDMAIDCVTPTIVLDGTESSTGPVYGYYWETTDGNIVSGETTLTPEVNASGTYTLFVYDNIDNCEAIDEVVVTAEMDLPMVSVEEPEIITCILPSITLNGSNSDSGEDFSIDWSTVDGNIVSGGTSLTPEVNAGGTYTLTITNILNGCINSEDVLVEADVINPTFSIEEPDMITCSAPEVEICVIPLENVDHIIWEDGTVGFCQTVNSNGIFSFTAYAENGCSTDGEIEVQSDTSIPVAIAGEDQLVTCDVNSVILDGSGSSTGENISYQWLDALGNVLGTEMTYETNVPGTYTLDVINGDNGCVTSDQVVVSHDKNVPIAIAGDDQTLTCTLSEVTLDGSASTQGDNISYEWQDEAGNVLGSEAILEVQQSGTYTLIVNNSDNGCTNMDQVFVDEFINTPDPSFSLVLDYYLVALNSSSTGTDDVSTWTSSDGQSADGFTAVFTFLSSGDFEICHNLTNECGTESTCETITITILPLAYDANISNVSCPGITDGSITVAPNGGVPDYTILWSGPDGFTSDAFQLENLSGGQYEMTLTDIAGTSLTELYIVVEPDPFTVDFEVEDEIDQNQNGAINITVSGGTPPYEYSWSNGETVKDLDNLAAGDYTLIITDANGCTYTVTITVDMKTNNFDLPFVEHFVIHPNPSFNDLVVELKLNKVINGHLTILDKLGRQVQRIENVNNSAKINLDLSDLNAGLYFIRFETEEGTISRKLIKL